MNNLTVKTEAGLVEGILSKDETCRIFKGIPYAEPPTGELRFTRTQPKKPWIGVRAAKAFPPKAYQADSTKDDFYSKEFPDNEKIPMSEDCLYLNIWTPAVTADQDDKLPVLMWIHGGAYMHGNANECTFDGEGFASKGVILVTINYRVGALGFFAHEELEKENPEKISGNYGYWDQINALKWIYQNIESFGGDKDRITVCGQSAGCMSTQTLVSTDVTRGMIRGAILQSGGGIPGFASDYSKARQIEISKKLMARLGVSTIAEMRNLSAESIAYGAYDINASENGLCWMPNVDGYLLEDTVVNLALNGNVHDIPYIIGSTKDEMGRGSAEVLEESAKQFALNQEKLGRAPVYVYHFERALPGDDAGAFHSAELWYEFETMERCWRPFEEHDYQLSREMSCEWASFVKTGKPGKEWPPCTAGKPFVRKYI